MHFQMLTGNKCFLRTIVERLEFRMRSKWVGAVWHVSAKTIRPTRYITKFQKYISFAFSKNKSVEFMTLYHVYTLAYISSLVSSHYFGLQKSRLKHHNLLLDLLQYTYTAAWYINCQMCYRQCKCTCSHYFVHSRYHECRKLTWFLHV